MNSECPRYTKNTTPLGITLNDCSTAFSMKECKRRARQEPWITTTINSAAGKAKQSPANMMECFIHIPQASKKCRVWNPTVVRTGIGHTAFPLQLG